MGGERETRGGREAMGAVDGRGRCWESASARAGGGRADIQWQRRTVLLGRRRTGEGRAGQERAGRNRAGQSRAVDGGGQ